MENSDKLSIVFLECNFWEDCAESRNQKNDQMAQMIFDVLAFHSKVSFSLNRVIGDDLQTLPSDQPAKTVPALVAVFNNWKYAEGLYNSLLQAIKGTRLHHNVVFGAILHRSPDKRQELGSRIAAPSWGFGHA